ncbi:HNH endonuclease family protein [Nostoc sp. C110]|uniref:HNH endonuclease family protein n=1 Tax=Nostoc sp. C110 TaxID=3349876 RepID=UPI00370DBE9D
MDDIFLKQADFERIFSSHLKISTYSQSIESLFRERNLNKIKYDPYYQRNYVWTPEKATFFIESILLGTEIPPIILFDSGNTKEVIDGRQRFETILRFLKKDLKLTEKGLYELKELRKKSFQDLSIQIQDLFFDSKLRVFEFAVVNEPKLDSDLEDKIKKEIFSRYNSGITPLKKAEIDNAAYLNDPVTKCFKDLLINDVVLAEKTYQLFLKHTKTEDNIKFKVQKILTFVRKQLILSMLPIRSYASSQSRTETIDKLYELIALTSDPKDLCTKLIKRFELVEKVNSTLESRAIRSNRLVCECLLWAFSVLEKEKVSRSNFESVSLSIEFSNYIAKNIAIFAQEGSHFYAPTLERYQTIANFFSKKLNTNFNNYLGGGKPKINASSQDDTLVKVSQLETLRTTKPDPQRVTIDGFLSRIRKKRLLLRPPYQRSEVISIPKASALIESILLGIQLPPIFIFSRSDGVWEVIDGQQRLLSILAFTGGSYIDEEGNEQKSKNDKFPLRQLRILKDLEKCKFDTFDVNLQDRIYDFPLLVVEIEERINTQFQPVDLFIRLNNKPFPILENSFEMWNAWVKKDLIDDIKKNAGKHKSWFYITIARNKNDYGDRMQNEELYTLLVYLDYHKTSGKGKSTGVLNIHIKNNSVNARIKDKRDVTKLLHSASTNVDSLRSFRESIKHVESFIKNLRLILLDKDIDDGDVNDFLREELNSIFDAGRNLPVLVRRFQDFYMLWHILSDLNYEMAKFHREEIKKKLKELFLYMKKPSNADLDIIMKGFNERLEIIKSDFKREDRRLRLTEEEKRLLIKSQGNKCALTGAGIYYGDELHYDHIKPLAVGGSDTIDNIQATHPDANRKKGAYFSSDSI